MMPETAKAIAEAEAHYRRRLLQMTVMGLVAMIALTSFNILYTNHAVRTADQRWCELIVGLDDNYRAAPKGSLPKRAVQFAQTIRRLREGLRCPDTPAPPILPQSATPAPSATG